MKNFFILTLLMVNTAFANENTNIIKCPLDNGAHVNIDLKESFLHHNPSGTVRITDQDGSALQFANIICTGHFLPGYQGAVSCVGLTSYGRLIRVKVNQYFVGGDIQADSYIASLSVETSSANVMQELAKKITCTLD